MNPLSSIQGLLIGVALSAIVAGTGGFTLAWRLQNANVEAIQLADAKAENAAVAAAHAQDDAQRKLSDDAGAAAELHQAGIRTVFQTIHDKVRIYVPAQADANCVVPLGAIRLLDASSQGIEPGGKAGALVVPGQPDDRPSGVAFSDLVALSAEHDKAYFTVAQQLRDLQTLIRSKQAAAAAAPSK